MTTLLPKETSSYHDSHPCPSSPNGRCAYLCAQFQAAAVVVQRQLEVAVETLQIAQTQKNLRQGDGRALVSGQEKGDGRELDTAGDGVVDQMDARCGAIGQV